MSGHYGPSKQCLQRLQKELREVRKGGHDLYDTAPDPRNLLHWLVVINGPSETPYETGRYLVRIEFPNNYPFAPPDIIVLTPNGRFSTGEKICLSNTSFHRESWSPLWNIDTIITGLIAFWTAESGTAGSIEASSEERRLLARESRQYNVKTLQAQYKVILPEQYAADLAALQASEQAKRAGEGTNGEAADTATTSNTSMTAGAPSRSVNAAVTRVARGVAMCLNCPSALLLFTLIVIVLVPHLRF